jgi:predicted glycosyltransferase
MRMHVQKGAELIRRVIEIGEEKNDWHAMAFVLKNFYFPPEQKQQERKDTHRQVTIVYED